MRGRNTDSQPQAALLSVKVFFVKGIIYWCVQISVFPVKLLKRNGTMTIIIKIPVIKVNIY